MKTLYVGNDNTVVLTCPACDKAKVVDVSRYLTTDGPVKFTFRFQCDDCRCGHASCQECLRQHCSLGHVNTVRLERRRTVRKMLGLTGVYLPAGSGRERRDEMMVRIVDISRKGLRVEFPAPLVPTVGAAGTISFQLDDPKKTRISKTVRARRVRNCEVVLDFDVYDEFSPEDKAIGFYLMNL